MTKQEKEVIALKYSGKIDGLTFEKFDNLVIRWGRKRWGDKYALAIWQDDMLKVGDLNLMEDLDAYTFEAFCEQMYDILSLESPKYAAELFNSERFWTKKWQIENRQRQREICFCYLEEITSGEAARQLLKRGVGQMPTMRKFFFDRFGAGQPEVLAERAKVYLLGMPDSNGEVFPPRIMENKLDKLETEREFLLEMYPKDKRDTYDTGKESVYLSPHPPQNAARGIRSGDQICQGYDKVKEIRGNEGHAFNHEQGG
jgi:hypothetical protein